MKAFPQINNSYEDHRTGCEIYQYDECMDLRDYFAAKAMQGFIVSHKAPPDSWVAIAKNAYLMADAMMEARNDH